MVGVTVPPENPSPHMLTIIYILFTVPNIKNSNCDSLLHCIYVTDCVFFHFKCNNVFTSEIIGRCYRFEFGL